MNREDIRWTLERTPWSPVDFKKEEFPNLQAKFDWELCEVAQLGQALGQDMIFQMGSYSD